MSAQRGFQAGGSPGDLFRAAAEDYARFRRPYPLPVVSHLVDRFGLDGKGRLLDVGCGTGQVFETLAHRFEETVALDADAEMVHHARRRASELGPANVRVLPAGFAEKYGMDNTKVDDPQALCTKSELLKVMGEQRAATLAALGKTSDADLGRKLEGWTPNVGALFIAAAGDHWLMHLGQWSVIRRQLGRKPLF